jgi:[ribosomal protein S5]-alanine N-acetyltransferase
MKTKTILETERLLLREMEWTDADDLASILCDAENMRFYTRPFTQGEVDDWIRRNRERYRQGDGIGLWAVCLKGQDDTMIGDCGLVQQEVDGQHEMEIGYHFNAMYQGYGYATEAARACRDYGFTQVGRSKLISLIRPEHTRSRRVAERNGMTVEKETLHSGLRHLVYVVYRQSQL